MTEGRQSKQILGREKAIGIGVSFGVVIVAVIGGRQSKKKKKGADSDWFSI
jgi:hypothetical protein|tara:strand:- start:3243 stop:3395 length:153 start_codon:yes stop_codon:yes gene_type:complete